MNLAVHNQGVENGAAIVSDDEALNLNQHGFQIHFDDHCDGATGGRAVLRAKVLGRFEARLGARFD